MQTTNRLSGLLLRFGHTVTSIGSPRGAFGRSIIEDLTEGRLPDAPGVCEDGLPREAGKLATAYLEEIDRCTKKAEDLTDRALKFARGMEFVLGTGEIVKGSLLLGILESVPGVGHMGALTWASEVVQVQRFPNAKAVAAYCGCDPSLKVSAGKVTSFSKRGGNKVLHVLLMQIAGSLIQRKNEPFGRWGYRLMKSHAKGGYRKGCGGVARRIAVALYHVQRTGEPFSYEKYNFWRAREVPLVPLSEMGLGRFEPLLARLGLENSQQVSDAFFTTLAQEKGVGEKCLEKVKQWISTNGKVCTSGAPSSDARVRSSATRLVRKLRTGC